MDEGAAPSEPIGGEPHREQIVRHRIEIAGKTIWQVIGAILITLVLLWALVQARSLVSMLILSLFFANALLPATNALVRRYSWRRGAAVGAIYLGGFVFAAFMIIVLLPSLAELAGAIGQNGADWALSLNQWLSDTFGFELIDAESAQSTSETTEELLAEWGDEIFGAVTGIAAAGASFIFSLATMAMFTFYFTADEPRIKRALLGLFPPNRQERLGWTWDESIKQTGGYFYSRSILMIINGLGFFFVMVLVGMPVALAIPLALFGGFVSVFIPAVGTYIGGAVPILVTLAIQGLGASLVVLGYVLVYQQVENYWLSPKISSDTMSLNGGVAFGAALAGGAIAGPMGAFMALPAAALITAFISNWVKHYEVVYHPPGEGADIASDDEEEPAS